MTKDTSRGSSPCIGCSQRRLGIRNMSVQGTGCVWGEAALRRRRRVTSLERVVGAQMQGLDSTRRRALVVVPIAEVGETEFVCQATRRGPLPAGCYRWRCKLIQGCCSRARGDGYRHRTAVEASSGAGRRGRAGLRGRWVRMATLGESVPWRQAQGLRDVLVLSMRRRVRRRRGRHGLFMARQVLRPHWMDCHLCLLGRILHARSPVAPPLLRVVGGSHWRAGYGRRRIRRGRVVREGGERA